MKRTFVFFTGIILLLLSFAALSFSGFLFNASDEMHIEPYIFQPNNLSTARIGRPVPIEQVSDEFVRDRLIKKFVYEYFYVIPDIDDVSNRTGGESVLAAMSVNSDVFNKWRAGPAKDIEKLAREKVLRTVSVADEILSRGDYLEIRYETKTWTTPNFMGHTPLVESGVLYIKLDFEKSVREQRSGKNFNVQEYLNNGGDPAAIFKFRVAEVAKAVQ